jgi:short-subunit dehydrogenase
MMLKGKNKLEGRVAVITGGAGDIGAALAKVFGAAGARVALLDVDGKRLEPVAERLRESGIEVIPIECDVRDMESCEAAMARAVERWGKIDLLINNAGISHRSLFSNTELGVLRHLFDVNFWGAVHCTRAALPEIAKEHGNIVVMSSMAGFAPIYGRTGYASSKHALHGFFDSLRIEVGGQGVKILVVCPGPVATTMHTRSLAGDGTLAGARKVGGDGLATPESIAAQVMHAMLRGRRRMVLTHIGRFSWWLNRIAPRMFDQIMLRIERSEFEQSRQSL